MERSPFHLPSYLSPDVQELFCALEGSVQTHLGASGHEATPRCIQLNFLNEDGTLNWEKLSVIFSDISDTFSIHRQPREWFIQTIVKCGPLFAESQFAFSQMKEMPETLKKLCSWTSKEEDIEKYFLLYKKQEVTAAESIMVLTSIMERALGNVFLLKGETVPFLLRDLLSSHEITEMLGIMPVVFLQLVMGTPLALNIRNLVWHGFPHESELCGCLVPILYLLTSSVGALLEKKQISFETITKRPQIKYNPLIFKDTFPVVKCHVEEIKNMLMRSKLIPESHLLYWEHGLNYYSSDQFGRSLVMLLPQLEHLMRSAFCVANNCPERALTAESTAFYTTFNEIMAQPIVGADEKLASNQFISFLGETVVEIVQDLLDHPTGPRIRDKVSHGECDLESIPSALVDTVICLALVIMKKCMTYVLYNHSGDKTCQQTSFESEVLRSYEKYTSQFHSSSLLSKDISSLIFALESWENFPYPDFGVENSGCNKGILQFRSELKHLLNKKGVTCTAEDISKYINSTKVKTVFRHKREGELWTVLKQVAANMQNVNTNIVRSLTENFAEYSCHQMRSRKRETYQNLLRVVPNLKNFFICVLYILILCRGKVNSAMDWSDELYSQVMKWLRNIRQFTENCSSLSRPEKNRWCEIETLNERYCKSVSNCFNKIEFIFL